ncbi:hypothetical protein GGH93_003406 [Coemansia aciculifera]|nr:hypothetical protein GGH93_003406 [Coemansia aciculifera]
MCSAYFGDDMQFRGNADTLELLDLHLSPESFKVLKTHKIFTPVGHQQLRRVKLGQITKREQNLFRTDVEFMRFLMNIGPNAVERVVNNALRAPILQSIIPVLSDHTCIQTLGLPFTRLELWDVLALVKALPLFSNLKSKVPAIGALPKGVSEEKLPAYVRETYSPVGVQFRRWCLVASASDGFRQRALRLFRLLFGGWNNELPDVEAAHARSNEARLAAITAAMAKSRI